MEIDLLRDGHSVVAAPEHRVGRLGQCDYLISVERAGQLGRFEIYRRSHRDPLPTINIPLAGDDPDVPLKLQDAVAQVYKSTPSAATVLDKTFGPNRPPSAL